MSWIVVEVQFFEKPKWLQNFSNIKSLLDNVERFKYYVLLTVPYWVVLYFLLKKIIKKDVQNSIKSEKIDEIRETSKTIIVSIDNSRIEGKIWDFDDEHLILNKNNEQIAIPWNEITWIGVKDDN